MIQIFASHHDGRYFVEVRGHADHAPEGHDVVCAAVSALLHTLAASVESIEIEARYIKMEKGHGIIRVCRESDVLNTLFTQIMLGFALVAHRYPAHVMMVSRGFFDEDEHEEN